MFHTPPQHQTDPAKAPGFWRNPDPAPHTTETDKRMTERTIATAAYPVVTMSCPHARAWAITIAAMTKAAESSRNPALGERARYHGAGS